MLALAEQRLKAAKTAYCYLDGSTTDRASVVKQFQSEDGPGLFLISLKAGGAGLILTAAEHVFLIDPWWNPAAEAQAIDRAHRRGQSSTVFVYRLIAQDAVEERVLELQRNKRELADAIPVGNLSHEALGLLLS
jgi:SNF2 family DNA or RNA helicase